MLQIGLKVELGDQVRFVYGVGDLQTSNFTIQVGRMKYAREMDGILGFDFLMTPRAIIDLNTMQFLSPLQ